MNLWVIVLLVVVLIIGEMNMKHLGLFALVGGVGLAVGAGAGGMQPVPVMSAEDIVHELRDLPYRSNSPMKNGPILAQDPKQRIWQLRVLEQFKLECWAHQLYNVLYLGLICTSDKKQIAGLYEGMLDKKIFDEFVGELAKNLKIMRGARRGTIELNEQFLEIYGKFFPSFASKLLSCVAPIEHSFGDKQSESLVEMLAMQMYGIQSEVIQGDNPKGFERYALEAQDAACFFDLTRGLKMLEQVERLAKAETALLCVPLDANMGSQQHAVALVVHKFKGINSYFLADSSNKAFTEGGNTYAAAIQTIKRFIESSTYLKETLLRGQFYFIFQNLNQAEDDLGAQRFSACVSLVQGVTGMIKGLQANKLTELEEYMKFYKKVFADDTKKLLEKIIGVSLEARKKLEDGGKAAQELEKGLQELLKLY